MEKIDLCEAIVKNFNLANGNNEKLERLNALFRYFIRDNIKNLFGRNEFDTDELEVVKVRDGMVIDSIFGIKLHIVMSHEGDFEIVAYDMDNKREYFKVFMNDEKALNECFVEGHSYKYEIDIVDDVFSYTLLDEHNEVEYSGYLQPLGAKRRQFEIFEYQKTVPEEPEEKSGIGKIIDRFKGDNFVHIDTGYTLQDVVHNAAMIFDRLKLEADKVKNQNKKLENQGN